MSERYIWSSDFASEHVGAAPGSQYYQSRIRNEKSAKGLLVFMRGATDLFDDPGLATAAANVIAALHPYAVDFIAQAPVLVVALAQDQETATEQQRSSIARRFAAISQSQPLGAVLRAFGIAPQLRSLSGHALRTRDWHTLKCLSVVNPSRLAQSVPQSASGQRRWLDAIERWALHMQREFFDARLYLDWASANLSKISDDLPIERVIEIANFAGNNRACFNERWTFAQAVTVSDRWHADVARKDAAAALLSNYEVGWNERIDYGPLPGFQEVDGFEFVALLTANDIFVEGRQMHHCLSAYPPRVMSGKSHLFSIRRNNRRVATLEVQSPSLGGLLFELGQLRGPCNREVAVRVICAAGLFVDELNMAIYLDRLHRRNTKATRHEASVDSKRLATIRLAGQAWLIGRLS